MGVRVICPNSYFYIRKEVSKMIEIAIAFMVQLVQCIPPFIALYVLFDFVGSLLFNKR
jgi:hypothetical protein